MEKRYTSAGSTVLPEAGISVGSIRVALGDDPQQALPEMTERAGAMAELRFDQWAQLTEGFVILGNKEKRIKTHSLGIIRR